jgi:FixJ family two-component response regulator
METNTQWPRHSIAYAIDDDDSFRQSILRALNAAGLEGEGYASAGDYLIDRITGRRHAGPACILLDIAMPGPNGIELMKALALDETAPSIVFVTGRDDILTSVDVMKSGAVDYLVKPVNTQRLLLSIARALRIDMQRHAVRDERDALLRRMKLLTHEERMVFHGVVMHRLNKQMAVQLNVCERTVKTLRSRMMEKLQLSTVPELVRAETLLEMSHAEGNGAAPCPRTRSAVTAR